MWTVLHSITHVSDSEGRRYDCISNRNFSSMRCKKGMLMVLSNGSVCDSMFFEGHHATCYVKVYLSHSYVTCRMRACDVRVFAMRTVRFACYSTQPSHRSGKILSYQGRRQERWFMILGNNSNSTILTLKFLISYLSCVSWIARKCALFSRETDLSPNSTGYW